MTGDQQARLVVTWQTSADAPPGLLAALVAAFADLDAGEVRVVRACRMCGSDRHGQPRVIAPDGAGPLQVSVSRSGGRAVVAVTDAGPVGVDVEALPQSSSLDLRTWVRKESLVKATGHGLMINPDLIDVGPPDADPALRAWPGPEPLMTEAWILDLESPPGFVAAVTVLANVRPRLITAWGVPAG